MSRVSRERIASVAFAAVHMVVFVAFYKTLGPGVAIFALLPAVVAGWFFGWQSGLIAGVVLMLINAILILLLFGSIEPSGIFILGSLFIIATGTAVGWLHQQLKHANEMAVASNALREGITAVNSSLDLPRSPQQNSHPSQRRCPPRCRQHHAY